MFVSDVNDVKIYNLSAGKSLPNVLTQFQYKIDLLLMLINQIFHSG